MHGGADPIFDRYKDSYVQAVQDSVRFSGLGYGFFLRSKAALLQRILARRLPTVGAPSVLDVGCGVGALHPLLRASVGDIHGEYVSAECVERTGRDNPL